MEARDGRGWCLNVRANEDPLAFLTNAPWSPTGYGQQTSLFVPQLHKHYDMGVSSFYGLEGASINWNDIPIYPGLGGEFGNDYLVDHAKRHFDGGPRDGLVVTLLDVWVLDPRKAAQLNMACWVPVDHEPAPPAVLEFFHHSQAVPLAMSRFGEKQLAGLNPIYVPHGIDTDVYRPHERKEMRKLVGVSPDAFLVGMVAANKGRPSRKGFQQAFEAFRLFRERHNDAILYLHTMTSPAFAQGEDIMALMQSLGIPGDAVLTADQYRVMLDPYSPKTMGKIFSSLDVLINPAMGEGFGLAPLEAQSCGIPAIVTNFSAMPEVCGAGWHVACRPYWTQQNSWQALPDVEDLVEALNHCYSLSNAARKQLSEKARRHALQYDVRRVMEEHMVPALKDVEERFEDRRPLELVAA